MVKSFIFLTMFCLTASMAVDQPVFSESFNRADGSLGDGWSVSAEAAACYEAFPEAELKDSALFFFNDQQSGTMFVRKKIDGFVTRVAYDYTPISASLDDSSGQLGGFGMGVVIFFELKAGSAETPGIQYCFGDTPEGFGIFAPTVLKVIKIDEVWDNQPRHAVINVDSLLPLIKGGYVPGDISATTVMFEQHANACTATAKSFVDNVKIHYTASVHTGTFSLGKKMGWNPDVDHSKPYDVRGQRLRPSDKVDGRNYFFSWPVTARPF